MILVRTWVLINFVSNNTIFTTCVRSLLGTLRLWDPARHGAEGLTLMLSASSPSDTEHRFHRPEIKDDYPFHYAEDVCLAPDMVEFHRTSIADLFRRYSHRRRPPLSNGHIKRIHGTPLCLKPERDWRGRFVSQGNSFPAVPMVKGLLIRRQFRREIHVGTLSWLLGRSFVALEWFRFERNISPETCLQSAFDRGMKRGIVFTASIRRN